MTTVAAFYDERTATLTYVVHSGPDAAVIDPVRDYDPASGAAGTEALKPVLGYLAEHQLTLRLILETHAHADHLSGAPLLKAEHPGAALAIGGGIRAVQAAFLDVLALPRGFTADGAQFDRLLRDGETVQAGELRCEVLATPGHTPACCSFRFGAVVFTGDALFMPDYGTGRCDFPGGCARTLFRSITGKLYTLPDDTRLYAGHDYRPGGREVRYESTVGEQKRSNVHLRQGMSEDEFVDFRETRDRTLAAPKLLYQSLQVNLNAGLLPAPEPNGVRYLKMPIFGG